LINTQFLQDFPTHLSPAGSGERNHQQTNTLNLLHSHPKADFLIVFLFLFEGVDFGFG